MRKSLLFLAILVAITFGCHSTPNRGEGFPKFAQPIKGTRPPKYTKEMKIENVDGAVLLKLKIDENGNLISSQIYQSLHPLADQAALEWAKSTRFQPFFDKQATPMKSTIVLPLKFKKAR